MMVTELNELLTNIQRIKCETQTLEIKAAGKGCPKKVYDTLSSFSNQDIGGIIVFGVDEADDFRECGVYDAQDLQKHIREQCNQMEPRVRPVFTVAEKDGKVFVSAEIPGIDITLRPCSYSGKGRIKGSYVRVGDADELMSEYEIYSFEAFRKKYQDDIRISEKSRFSHINEIALQDYLLRIKYNRPNLANLDDEKICELMSITKENIPTLAALLLFGNYPQAQFPQLCITAISVPGKEIGELGVGGERFIDNKRIEGTLPQMLDEAIAFVAKNTKTKTIINSSDGKRIDRSEYPLVAVREAILNALIHRDYSIHTEGMPIQLVIYEDRLEIKNPGGLYGRISIDKLGKAQPDTRNPVIAFAMEILQKAENRYSGIPTIYRELKEANLPKPVFANIRGSFSVCFYKGVSRSSFANNDKGLLEFCKVPRNRNEIADFLNIKTVTHAIKTYVQPLVEQGLIKLEYPDKPRSHKQLYTAISCD